MGDTSGEKRLYVYAVLKDKAMGKSNE